MKRSILTVIVLATLSVCVARADILQAIEPAPTETVPGTPGTPTPAPYPQVTPPSMPNAGGTENSPPVLPKIEMPRPPKDQPLPGLDQKGQTPSKP